MTKYTVIVIGAILSLLSCGTKAPKGELLSIEYTSSGTMSGYQYEGRIEQISDSTFLLTAMKMNYGPLFRRQIGKREMAKFKEIIISEKMYNYKEHYRPFFDIKDGHRWHFSAKFSDSTSIYSNGENAIPSGNGLIRILNRFHQLIEDATEELPDSLDD